MAEFIKYFNPKEVDKGISLVSKIVEDILLTNKKLIELNNKDSLSGQETLDLMNITHQLNDYLREIEELGCFYSEVTSEVSLVEFPTIIHNRDAYLCWMSDEFHIKYFRYVDDNPNVRKIIPKEYFEQN